MIPVAGGDFTFTTDGFFDPKSGGLQNNYFDKGNGGMTTYGGKECFKYGDNTWQSIGMFDLTKGYTFSSMVLIPKLDGKSRRRYFTGSGHALRNFLLLADNIKDIIEFRSTDVGLFKDMGKYIPDSWFHFTSTVKDSTFKVYINGILTGAVVSPVMAQSFYPVSNYEGDVYCYNRRLYKRALTEEEVRTVFSEDYK